MLKQTLDTDEQELKELAFVGEEKERLENSKEKKPAAASKPSSAEKMLEEEETQHLQETQESIAAKQEQAAVLAEQSKKLKEQIAQYADRETLLSLTKALQNQLTEREQLLAAGTDRTRRLLASVAPNRGDHQRTGRAERRFARRKNSVRQN